MNVEIRDEKFRAVVGGDVEIEEVGSGFEFTEGPIWNHAESHLIFSDIPGNIMRRWRPDGSIETWRQPSNMANGNTYDGEGRVVTCEHATSRVTRTESDGSVTVLATHYGGKELNSPNDIVVKSDGAIYFTDPSFGRMEYFGRPREQQLGYQGAYRLDPDSRELTLLVDDFDQPNGLCFSLDESQLFINDTMRAHIRVFDVNDEGTLENGRVWAEVTGGNDGAPDGMKVDSQGNLYVTGPGGIHVFDPDAACLGVIKMPQGCANFCWGDDDLRSLFVTATTSLYRIRVRVAGRNTF
ncbi:MAG: SMP-30/gluconolactonase/LRE family protein [Caldilineaceae bacterium SB0670_bin_27]|uniref:SMP-30/gluconolactonase/LRE family protein n=1 Tax=Caldilineaceae bacterium SB0664_bin_27 TaxID=2605260 RepID=A0A6B0YWM3_9CHLR|nr:SMP-30/gluconolactonase/LRE family protein [Caldilineaceae bacterium SB0664_bin_27]MYJ76591.1 SMP-30/gluconolactonase/LRE family protein [Caldilineaceae bacterium SB0670_bin_27]